MLQDRSAQAMSNNMFLPADLVQTNEIWQEISTTGKPTLIPTLITAHTDCPMLTQSNCKHSTLACGLSVQGYPQDIQPSQSTIPEDQSAIENSSQNAASIRAQPQGQGTSDCPDLQHGQSSEAAEVSTDSADANLVESCYLLKHRGSGCRVAIHDAQDDIACHRACSDIQNVDVNVYRGWECCCQGVSGLLLQVVCEALGGQSSQVECYVDSGHLWEWRGGGCVVRLHMPRIVLVVTSCRSHAIAHDLPTHYCKWPVRSCLFP